ncbi:NAD(P)-dependent oxidoreductase [Sphingobium lignivorans]|uniref:Phosphoglycerate dehydrogenase-like enzyme n=1 Tax=Sphingobium lignivorans TaxID=2735886 RepID=A0ABR6NH59_9SPHN|nr:NAD(P)-dependent oxidoreductase [Sphingobium lignivorans]MBB5986615.1 phosphoglycerate dehydrogenase-like enzyme [Sphingobium lignivorans]
MTGAIDVDRLNTYERPARALVVASQLGGPLAQLGSQIAATLPDRLPNSSVAALAPGSFSDFPTDAEVLIPWGIRRDSLPPPGWPFGLRLVQLVTVGSDGYPAWLGDGPVVNCMRGPAGQPIAEFALAALLAEIKQVRTNDASTREDWRMRPLRAVRGFDLGLLGFGPINRHLARFALALGMNVRAVRRSDAPFGIEGVWRAASAAELFATSDAVVLAAPATARTRHIVDRTVLASARRGLHLVNVGRGSLVDHDALHDALESGIVGFATLDTTEPEPLPEGHSFYALPNVRLTGHSSSATPDFARAVLRKLVDNLADYRAGNALEDLVDAARGY